MEPGDGARIHSSKPHFSLGQTSSSDRHPAPTAVPPPSPRLHVAAPCPRVETVALNLGLVYVRLKKKSLFL